MGEIILWYSAVLGVGTLFLALLVKVYLLLDRGRKDILFDQKLYSRFSYLFIGVIVLGVGVYTLSKKAYKEQILLRMKESCFYAVEGQTQEKAKTYRESKETPYKGIVICYGQNNEEIKYACHLTKEEKVHIQKLD